MPPKLSDHNRTNETNSAKRDNFSAFQTCYMAVFASEHVDSYKIAMANLVDLACQVFHSLGKTLPGKVPQILGS